MKTLAFQGDVDTDGKLRLEIASGLPPGRVEGVIMVGPTSKTAAPPYDTLEGAMVGVLPADADIDADLAEMNRAWQQKLDHIQ